MEYLLKDPWATKVILRLSNMEQARCHPQHAHQNMATDSSSSVLINKMPSAHCIAFAPHNNPVLLPVLLVVTKM